MKHFLVTIQAVAVEEAVAKAVAADIENVLDRYRTQLTRAEVHTDPFMEGGAADRGEPFDRQAARTSGVTVDVTQPGGVN